MKKLPDEWKIETIGNFCDILDNQRVPISSEKRAHLKGDIPYYGANGVQGYINDFIFNETLVLLAEDGGHFNDYQTRPIAYMVEGKSWINNHTHVLRAKNGENHFLYYSLVHKDITSFINGGTRAKLNRGELVKIPLIIPPLQEQKKIAEILNTVDQKIAFIDNQIKETELLKKGLMQKLLTEGIGHTEFKDSEIGRIPESWEVVQLSDIVKFSNGKGHEQFINDNGEYIVINSKFISTNGEVKKYSNKNLSPLKSGNITMVMSDIPNGKALAKCFLINEDNKYTLNQRICSLQPKKDYQKFLFYTLNRNKYFMKFNDGVNQTNLRKNEVLECPIKLPPIEEQKQIAEILSTTDEKLETLKAKKESFEKLKKGLMQKLLTGEVRV